MKQTLEQIMQKLMEQWRSFLSEFEKERYGASYEQFKEEAVEKWQNFDGSKEEYLRWLGSFVDEFFKREGAGSFRTVYVVNESGLGDRIIKVARRQHPDQSIQDNKEEIRLSQHSNFARLFPDIEDFGPSEDFPAWIISERVKPFDDSEQMVFHFPAFQKAKDLIEEYMDYVEFGSWPNLFQTYLLLATLKRSQDAKKDGSFKEKAKDLIRDFNGFSSDNPRTELMLKIFQKVHENAGEQLKKLENFVSSHPVTLNEYSYDNVGVDSRGNFVIIDPSMMKKMDVITSASEFYSDALRELLSL